MKDVPISRNYSWDLEDMMGHANFTEEGVKRIETLIEQGALMEFGISFIGELQEDGTYKNVELLGLSMIPARKQ